MATKRQTKPKTSKATPIKGMVARLGTTYPSTQKDFVIQYVLARASALSGEMNGVSTVLAARKAWDEIQAGQVPQAVPDATTASTTVK